MSASPPPSSPAAGEEAAAPTAGCCCSCGAPSHADPQPPVSRARPPIITSTTSTRPTVTARHVNRKRAGPPAGDAVPTGGTAPQRVKITSKKAAPSAEALRQEREQKELEAELAALSVELKITRPKGSAPKAKANTHHHGDSDEEKDYYVVTEAPEISDEERIELMRKAQEARLQEKHMQLRRRQGIARRPDTLLRTRYGQLKSIEGGPRRQNGGRGSDSGDTTLMLTGGPVNRSPVDQATAEDRSAPKSQASGRDDNEHYEEAPPVNPSPQMEIDYDDEDEEEYCGYYHSPEIVD